MADSPVTLNKGGTMAQAALAATSPEGMLISPVWKRGVAFILDMLLITLVVYFLTKGNFFLYLMDWELITTSQAHFFILTLIVHFAIYWLYFKYTGKSAGRSLGQRAMRIAIVHDDGTLLGENHWGRRAIHKLRYVIPGIGQLIGIIDLVRTWRDSDKRSPMDKANHTVAAVDWSLPQTTRAGLR